MKKKVLSIVVPLVVVVSLGVPTTWAGGDFENFHDGFHQELGAIAARAATATALGLLDGFLGGGGYQQSAPRGSYYNNTPSYREGYHAGARDRAREYQRREYRRGYNAGRGR